MAGATGGTTAAPDVSGLFGPFKQGELRLQLTGAGAGER